MKLGEIGKTFNPSTPPTIYEELYPPNKAYDYNSGFLTEANEKLTIALSITPLSLREFK